MTSRFLFGVKGLGNQGRLVKHFDETPLIAQALHITLITMSFRMQQSEMRNLFQHQFYGLKKFMNYSVYKNPIFICLSEDSGF